MPTPLKTYWSANRGDNFETATQDGIQSALQAGYVFIRNEAFVFTEAERQPDTIPLRLFWSSDREDNFTAASAQGAADARVAGYQEIRIEGYVYPAERPNTVPLRLFWSAQRQDNFLTATAQGEADARAAGYQEIRIEGYALANAAAERVVRAEAEQDFGGGKHGMANASLDNAGNLSVTIHTWTNSPFQGFTMGVKVLLLNAQGSVIAETTGGPGPYGVNGRLVPGGPPERIDTFNQNFANQLRNVSRIRILLFWAPRWRILDIVNQVVEVAVEVVRWVEEFCAKYPEVCEQVRKAVEDWAMDDSGEVDV